MFGHEKFEAYELSIKSLKKCFNILEELPAGYSTLKDQLRRAAISVPLNIAEGSGKMHQADKKKYYAIARGSAMECSAICDVMEIILGNNSEIVQIKNLLKSVVSILSSVLMKRGQGRGRG